MAETHDFKIVIETDAGRAGRFRWNISEDGKVRDKSFYSYATRREAQVDADKFVEKAQRHLATSLAASLPPSPLVEMKTHRMRRI